MSSSSAAHIVACHASEDHFHELESTTPRISSDPAAQASFYHPGLTPHTTNGRPATLRPPAAIVHRPWSQPTRRFIAAPAIHHHANFFGGEPRSHHNRRQHPRLPCPSCHAAGTSYQNPRTRQRPSPKQRRLRRGSPFCAVTGRPRPHKATDQHLAHRSGHTPRSQHTTTQKNDQPNSHTHRRNDRDQPQIDQFSRNQEVEQGGGRQDPTSSPRMFAPPSSARRHEVHADAPSRRQLGDRRLTASRHRHGLISSTSARRPSIKTAAKKKNARPLRALTSIVGSEQRPMPRFASSSSASSFSASTARVVRTQHPELRSPTPTRRSTFDANRESRA